MHVEKVIFATNNCKRIHEFVFVYKYYTTSHLPTILKMGTFSLGGGIEKSLYISFFDINFIHPFILFSRECEVLLYFSITLLTFLC